MLLSLHIGNGPEITPKSPAPIKTHTIGDIRTNIRLPGGAYAVSIHSIEKGVKTAVKYASVNAAPLGVNGQVCVRWKAPHDAGSYLVTLWKQRQKPPTRPTGPQAFTSFLETQCTMVTSFHFSLV